MSELLPCPLCGNPDVDNDEGVFHFPARGHVLETWRIQCGKPGCVSIEAGTREAVVAMWNTRAEAVPASAWRQAVKDFILNPGVAYLQKNGPEDWIEQRAISIASGKGGM